MNDEETAECLSCGSVFETCDSSKSLANNDFCFPCWRDAFGIIEDLYARLAQR